MTEPTGTPLIEGYTLGPFATNCFIVREPGLEACWIVDAGFRPEVMIERVRALGLTPSAILLTHAHADHIAGLEVVKGAFPEAPILIHAAEREWLQTPELNLSAGLGTPLVAPAADGTLEDGQKLMLGESAWRVIHTPGHSPGGVTLYCESAPIALVGDTLFAGSIGRYDFPTSDGPVLFASIREKLYTLPDATIVHPGHGPATTIGSEKGTNPYVRAEAV